MYDPTKCTEDDCTRAPVADGGGMCLHHLFRWALWCRHDDHDPRHLVLAA